MTQPGQPLNTTNSLSPAARFVWPLLIVATLYFCYFHNLGVLGLVGPDEPRYAWIARDMADGGDWVTPRLYGKPWFEKPVLYYWGAALSFKWFGISEAAARLPSAISALVATLAMSWLAWRIYGPETARWVLLLLPTTVGMIGFSHAAATDMPFAGMLTVAMVSAAAVVGLVPGYSDSSAWQRAGLLLLGVFLGLAVLAKGPAAIILSGGGVLSWAAFTKRWRDACRCLHPLAIGSLGVTALPWYVVCARRNPDFFHVFIIEHNFKRYLTAEFQHLQPFWYYVPILAIAFLPWVVLLLGSAVLGISTLLEKRRPQPTTLFLVCWALFCVLFFSVSRSKLPGYILPAVLPLGLLATNTFVNADPSFRKGLMRGLFAFIALLTLLAVALGGTNHFAALDPNADDSRLMALVPLFFALANGGLALKGRESGIPASGAFAMLPILALLLFAPKLISVGRPYDLSGRSIARYLEGRGLNPAQIFVTDMPRGQHLSLNFYLRNQIAAWDPGEPRPGFLLVRSKRCSEIMPAGWICDGQPDYLKESGYWIFRVENASVTWKP